MSDRYRLAHTLGTRYGVDPRRMSEFVSHVEALVRLGIPFTVKVNRYGDAEIEVSDDD